MFRYLIVSLLFSWTILSSSIVPDSLLYEKVQNIMGSKQYQLHKGLIKLILKDEIDFLDNDKINYYNLFKVLKENGLLDLKLTKPKDITIEFKILNKDMKSYKILSDIMHSIGYRYFFTKSMELTQDKELVWKIIFKAEYMLDPVVLLKELELNNCKVLDVTNKGSVYWCYEIDFDSSIIAKAIKIDKNEKVKFQKPLRAFFLKVNDTKQLQVISRHLNNWFPHIVFFDNDLKVLKVIKKDRVYRGLKIKVPDTTKYIKITDTYNLINIKRGLTIIVR
jgi:hypothetical protein